MALRLRLWRSFLRSAIIPLLVVEVGFLAIYWASSILVHRENVATVNEVSRQFLGDIARREAGAIGKELAGYSAQSGLLARQVGRALGTPFQPTAAERSRYAFDPDGSIYTVRDIGTTASYYSSFARPDRADLARVLRLGQVDPLMMDIKAGTPDVLSVYFNSRDSYNRIYPYIDAATQYPRGMEIPSYNFYYQADAAHNPARVPVWTDAYIDPAGHGWMISAIAPVWKGGRLEGVVGIDIGLQAIIDRLMRMDLPWGAYALLVDRAGRIIAMPPGGEKDFRLRELTRHTYAEAIRQDSFKPEAFDLTRRADTRPLAAAMAKGASGDARLSLGGVQFASFDTVPGPGWRLVVIAPARAIQAPANALRARLEVISYAMLAALVVFYILFFVALWRRAHRLSDELGRPIEAITALMQRIGAGEHRQVFAGSEVAELDQLGRELTVMGGRLGDAHDQIVHHEQAARAALDRQQQVNEQQARLVQVMSHELRTPLALIDSGAQILDRKADALRPEDLRRRSGRMRAAVRRIGELTDKLVASLQSAPLASSPARCMELGALVRERIGQFPASQVTLLSAAPVSAWGSPEAVTAALDAELDNALRYAGQDGRAVVRIAEDAGGARIEIEDDGPGLPDEELADVGKLFFRGSNAAHSAGAGVSLHLAARRLAETGGQIELVRAQGGGLCARIRLPKEAPGGGQ